MRIDLITLFPEFFDAPLRTGLVGKAIDSGAASVSTIDPRAFTSDVHRTVDDTPAGGGGGMVMKVGPLAAAIDAARTNGRGPVVLLTPQGRPLEQQDLSRWAQGDHLALIAGRYEGFDERVRARVDEEISLGDFVLTGGEYAALTIVDGVVRLLPGTLGNDSSSVKDSFSDGLLEHPHYTRPTSHDGLAIPDVLMSGHHERIETWRRAASLERTHERRPDSLAHLALSDDDRAVLDARPNRDVAIAVAGAAPEALPTLLAIAVAYSIGRVFLVGGGDVDAVADHVVEIVDRRPKRKRRGGPPKRVTAAADVFEVVSSWAEVPRPLYGSARDVSSAVNPRALAGAAPICLGFGAGLAEAGPTGWLPPIRQRTFGNALPLTAAVVAQLERLVGEG